MRKSYIPTVDKPLVGGGGSLEIIGSNTFKAFMAILHVFDLLSST